MTSEHFIFPILGTLLWGADIGGPWSEENHRSVQLIEGQTIRVNAHQFTELVEQLQRAYDIACERETKGTGVTMDYVNGFNYLLRIDISVICRYGKRLR
jgi:hypothetical protein